MADSTPMPTHMDLTFPTIEALRKLGGSAHIQEISRAVVEAEGFTEAQQARMQKQGDIPVIDYRLAWSRNYLKNIGAVESSSRGVWSLTELGWRIRAEEIAPLVKHWKQALYKAAQADKKGSASEDPEDEGKPDDQGWQDALLERLLKLSPPGFERLAQRLLREAGLRNVEVTVQTGDGGIDGVGDLRVSLISFPVYFQCKRYKGAVGPGAVRDFRGAMSGRGEKGLLITTGTFTKDARVEATRDGAPPVELVNGQDLCELLREYGMGVAKRTVEEYDVDLTFFDQFG